jgi:hypothetical protein
MEKVVGIMEFKGWPWMVRGENKDKESFSVHDQGRNCCTLKLENSFRSMPLYDGTRRR